MPWSILHDIISNATDTTIQRYPFVYKSHETFCKIEFDERGERLWKMLWIGIAVFIFSTLLAATIAILYVINRRRNSTGQFNVETANKVQGMIRTKIISRKISPNNESKFSRVQMNWRFT